MQIPDTGAELLRELAAAPAAPAIRLRLIGFDYSQIVHVIEVLNDGERAVLHAGGNGFLAVVEGALSVSLDTLRPAVGRLLGGRPDKWLPRYPQ